MKKLVEHDKEVLKNLSSISKRLMLNSEERNWLEDQMECLKSRIKRLECEIKNRENGLPLWNNNLN